MSSSIAYNRFGLGRRASEPDLDNPKAWLLAQISPTVPLPKALGPQPGTMAMIDMEKAYRAARKAQKQAAADNAGPGAVQAMETDARPGEAYIAQMGDRLQAALVTATPFAERLVHFWSNHFAISADKPAVRALVGPYEAEAIRPHVGGTFADMLLAVARHPAMILYLDNARSVGPASPMAQRRMDRTDRKTGLNENLAREILELHTLGVRSVYTQSDVTELARAITGWSVDVPERAEKMRGERGAHGFMYYPPLHEPGSRTLLGKRYPAGDVGQGMAILKGMAAHPATARHIATKLACHFIADDPPAAAIARLEKTFLDSRGDLPSVYRTLINLPEAWAPSLQKFKTPWEYVISALRLTSLPAPEAKRSLQLLRAMGQPPMMPGSPAGWPDTAARWVSSDGIAKRLSFAATLAGRAPASLDARSFAAGLFGNMLSETTRTELARAESGTQALTLLLASPEFMRR